MGGGEYLVVGGGIWGNYVFRLEGIMIRNVTVELIVFFLEKKG